MSFSPQVPLPVTYKGMPADCAYRLDLVIEARLIVEVKWIGCCPFMTRSS